MGNPAETGNHNLPPREGKSGREIAPRPFLCPDGSRPMRHCIYPGTFDPITYGHLDVLARAARLFDRITVAVAPNPGKDPLFTPEERIAMIRPNIAALTHVTVTEFKGLLIDFALAQQADAIIRGLRAFSDFEFEFNMALMNRHLQPRIETIFVMPNELFSYTSSSLVKQVAKFGGDVSHFVPPNVAAELKRAMPPAGAPAS
jgi:pantetheine-phosphate adenylyltransferase